MTVHPLEQPPPCRRCKYTDTELRQKLASNGTRMYAYQCLRCGENASAWIARAKIPNLNRPEWDETLSKTYYAQRSQDRLIQRDVERADWFSEHDQYLKTPAWRALRLKVFARSQGLCEGCRSRPATQAHHLTYAHWRHEFLWELVAVCDDCHERVHHESPPGEPQPT